MKKIAGTLSENESTGWQMIRDNNWRIVRKENQTSNEELCLEQLRFHDWLGSNELI